MNINFYSESYRPYISGVAISLENFALELSRRGHCVKIFAPRYHKGNHDDPLNSIRFPSISAPFYPEYRLTIPFSIKHFLYNRKHTVDIVHTHSPFQLGLVARGYAKKHHKPLLLHFHTRLTEYLHYIPLPKAITRPLLINYIRWFCQRCNTIIAPTAEIEQELRQVYKIKTPIAIIPTGISREEIDLVQPLDIFRRFNIASDVFLSIYCGRLSSEKNIELLLKAFCLVLKENPRNALIIVGFGPLELKLKKLCRKLAIHKHVFFAGKVSHGEILAYMKSAKLLVITSKTETQGLVLSEAKGCGLAALGVKAGGVANMISHGKDGLLTGDSKKDFAKAWLKLISKPQLLCELSSQAKVDFDQRFTSSSVTQKLESVYNSLVQL